MLIAVDGGRGRSDSEVGVSERSSSESSETEEGRGTPDGSSEDTDEGEETDLSVTKPEAGDAGAGVSETDDGAVMDGTRLGTSMSGTSLGGTSLGGREGEMEGGREGETDGGKGGNPSGSESSIGGGFGVPSKTSLGMLSSSLGQISAVS